ncbi:hypothetical protein ACK3YV_07440 [Aeromonas caviae]
MKSKSEIDQHYGFTSDRAVKYYLLSIAVMLLGFLSVFFLGLGILFLITSFAKVSSTLKELYLENGITVDTVLMSSTSENIEQNFKLNESDKVEEDEYSSDSFPLSDTTNPSSPTQIAWRHHEDDLRHR